MKSLLLGLTLIGSLLAAEPLKKNPKVKSTAVEVTYPPKLPNGKILVTDTSQDFLKPPATLLPGVSIAKKPPTVDLIYYPGQDYPGKPWSNWGDSLYANGKYYASIGDHLAPAGNAFIYEYDPATKKLRRLMDVFSTLNLPEGHYAPGKIHSRIDMGNDGCLYFSTHRGSTRVTTDQYHYKGDWILRHNPATSKTEIVSHGPVPKHCIPTSAFDPKRMIFYGGTAPGTGGEDAGVRFFAYDINARKVICDEPDGPARAMIFAPSTGRVYYNQSNAESALMCFDPTKGNKPVKIAGEIGLRAASEETPQGIVYTVSQGRKGEMAQMYAFHTKTEKVEMIGPAAVGSQQYITTLDADPTGRYIYYVPGAHGGSEQDNSAVVQYDTKIRQRKIIAFLHPFYQTQYGCTLKGTYSVALDPKGETIFITWNANRNSKAWDTCALTVLHIPESERKK